MQEERLVTHRQEEQQQTTHSIPLVVMIDPETAALIFKLAMEFSMEFSVSNEVGRFGRFVWLGTGLGLGLGLVRLGLGLGLLVRLGLGLGLLVHLLLVR